MSICVPPPRPLHRRKAALLASWLLENTFRVGKLKIHAPFVKNSHVSDCLILFKKSTSYLIRILKYLWHSLSKAIGSVPWTVHIVSHLGEVWRRWPTSVLFFFFIFPNSQVNFIHHSYQLSSSRYLICRAVTVHLKVELSSVQVPKSGRNWRIFSSFSSVPYSKIWEK